MEFLTSVAVGGLAGLRTRGTATFPDAVAAGDFIVVCVDILAENAAVAKSMQVMTENCIVAKESK
jgi:hypothetical protein